MRHIREQAYFMLYRGSCGPQHFREKKYVGGQPISLLCEPDPALCLESSTSNSTLRTPKPDVSRGLELALSFYPEISENFRRQLPYYLDNLR